jgi:hypothetical protein
MELPELPAPDIWVREDFGLGDSTVHQGYTADQMRAYGEQCALAERGKILAALKAEIDHCATNDVRLVPVFGRAQGVLGVPSSYIEAVIERFSA